MKNHYLAYILALIGLNIRGVYLQDQFPQREYIGNSTIFRQWKYTQNNPLPLRSASDDTASLDTAQSQIYKYIQANKQYDQRISDLIANSVLQFAHNVGKQISETSYHSNKVEVFSPVSIMAALALLMLGTRGRSYEELRHLFGIDRDAELLQNPAKFHEEFGLMLEDLQRQDTNTVLRKNANWRDTVARSNIRTGANRQQTQKSNEHIIKVANGLFTQNGYTLNNDYRQVAQSIYRSEVMPLDFQSHGTEARNYINQWVNQNTYGKIPFILSENVPRATNVVIASAVYFKSFWESNFFNSRLDSFYPDGRNRPPVRVQLMGTGGIFPYYESKPNDCHIIGFPYMGNVTTMYVIMPNQSSRTKLKELQQNLNAEKIEEMISNMSRKTAVLVLPKMHFTATTTMKEILKSFGLRGVFAGGGDLSLIGKNPGVQNVQNEQSFQNQLHLPQNQHAAFAPTDRFNEQPLIFDRFSDLADNTTDANEIHKSETATESSTTETENTKMEKKDDVEGKREKRQVPLIDRRSRQSNTLENLEYQRLAGNDITSGLFVDDILHKVDFDVNETGTEAAGATLITLKRSGTDVNLRIDGPFLLLIRHDPTKLVLFYGVINEPIS